jgi:lipopolysaccharide/colanic/teichoic acid biosynthesis glycosyltransferase
MSVVGPRPPLPAEVRQYHRWQRRRLSVKPGITCIWQVSGRSDVDFDRWMRLDLAYIDHWSLWEDVLICLKTVPAVFSARGAH